MPLPRKNLANRTEVLPLDYELDLNNHKWLPSASALRQAAKSLALFAKFFRGSGILLFLLLTVTPLAASLYEEPWGRDKQFFETPKSQTETHEGLLARTGVKMIRVHQKFVSPWDGPRSHFRPSSSQYTLLAMQRHGFFKGFMMGCSRLERENKDPWVYRTVEMAGFTFKEDIP